MSRALLFMLRESCDPLELVGLADKLGVEATKATLKASLPKEWVLKAQKEDARIASWAVKNCDDGETLAKIAASKATNRATVREALLGNGALSDQGTVEALKEARRIAKASREARGNSPVVSRCAAPGRREIEELIDEMIAKGARWNLDSILLAGETERLLSTDGVTTSDIDRLVEGLLNSSIRTETAGRILAERTGLSDVWGSGFVTSELWERSSYDVGRVLQELGRDASELGIVIRETADLFCANVATKNGPPIEVGLELTKAFLAWLSASEISECEDPEEVKDAFTPESVAELLNSKSKVARKLLGYQSLRGVELARYMAPMSAKQRLDTLYLASRDEDRVAEVLCNLKPGDKIDDVWVGRALEGVVSSKKSGLNSRIVERLSSELLMMYLSGELVFIDGGRVPSVKEAMELAQRLEGAPRAQMLVWAGEAFSTTRVNALGQSYLNKMVDEVPGVFGVLFDHPKVATRAYRLLRQSGCDIDVIADQMEISPGESLSRLCGVLKAMRNVGTTKNR